jgi:membrane-associated phospholipid phosphatase
VRPLATIVSPRRVAGTQSFVMTSERPAASTGSGLRATWILGRHEWGLFALSYGVLVAVGTVVGLLLKGPFDDTSVVRLDRRIAAWFAAQRTPNLNRYTVWGSDLADTFIKIAATAVIALVLLWIWRRWLEPLVLVMSLALEAAVFITVTTIVGRPRPDVERLEGSPVNSGFPSGHTAAAAAYTALAVVIIWHTDRRWLQYLVVAASALVTAVVGLSRMYRGMHYFTDVVAGVAIGAASVAIAATILLHAQQRRADRPFVGARAAEEIRAGGDGA